MTMDPNKDNSSSGENNRNCQLTPGANSRAARLSLPFAGGQSIFLDPMFRRHLEDMIRRTVRDGLQQISPYINLPPRLLPDQNIQARYRLQFINKVKDPTFTTKLVRDNNKNPIRVEIYDSYTQSKVSPDCSLSSVKVRITVLDAEFWKNKGVNWSRSEFISSVLMERDGKGPILIGRSLTIRLENGVGSFGNIFFNDNSSWTKSGFRLGVMVEVEGEGYYLSGERVQEGLSDHFQVRDRRGEASQKPDLLELKDEVQCLKKVGKDRASNLKKNNIKTVGDFLYWYDNKQPELRKILCFKSESDKGWKSMVEHAMSAKYSALSSSSQPRQDLVHMPGRINPLQTNGVPRLVGSGSSVRNPCENNLIISDTFILNAGPLQLTTAGALQVEVSSDSELLEDLLANGELTPSNNFQSPSRSNSFDAGSCEELVQRFRESISNSGYVGPLSPRRKAKMKILLKLITFLASPRRRARSVPPAIYQPFEQANISLLQSASSPYENNSDDQGDMPAVYTQLSPIGYLPPLSPMETQCPVFYDRNHANVESRNIMNWDSVQHTNVGGSPQLELPRYAADAESTPDSSMQFQPITDDFEAGYGVRFTGSVSNIVHGEPLTSRSNRKIKAILRSIAFLAVPRKRARIVPPTNQTTVLAM
ncbi:uncharacterized protein LOC144546933 isoform X2 [Carex rostrata]